MDPRLGAIGRDFPCLTCNSDEKNCPGHFGHIELVKPMYNIGFFSVTLSVLRCVCFFCSKLLIPPEDDNLKAVSATSKQQKVFLDVHPKTRPRLEVTGV